MRLAVLSPPCVVPTATFATGRATEDGLRISIGSAADQATLAEGLARRAGLLR